MVAHILATRIFGQNDFSPPAVQVSQQPPKPSRSFNRIFIQAGCHQLTDYWIDIFEDQSLYSCAKPSSCNRIIASQPMCMGVDERV